MTMSRIRQITTSLLLSVAYFTVILQWMWVSIIVLPPLIESGAFDGLTQPSQPTAATATLQPVELAGPALWLVGAVTIFILALTVVVLIKIPKAVLDTSETIVHKTTDTMIPLVTNHATLPAKKRRELSRRLSLALQLFVSILPALICLFLPPAGELTREIIITLALCMVIISVLGFTLAWFVKPAKTTSRTQSRASRG